MKTFTSYIMAFAALISLAACGGGGGSTSATPDPINTAPVPVSVVPAAPSNPDLVTTVAAATHPAGSIESGAWNMLSGERGACGFGLLNQDTRLDAASTAHSILLTALSKVENISWTGHGEDKSKPGYTGGDGLDRATQKGFPSTANVTGSQTVEPFNIRRPCHRKSP